MPSTLVRSRASRGVVRKPRSYLADSNNTEQFANLARRMIFLKGRDSHDYKFSSAVLEDYYHVSPAWRDRFLAAGIYNLLQPELANRIGNEKSRSLVTVGAEYVATGNPGCLLQIAKQLRATGSSTRVLHPVEILLP